MRGHHIYTRSWFEYGSKSKNAGTFTVEMTEGLLGDRADEILYNRINPMCAAVPEALAPRNTDRSVLRMYHLSADSTVICRSWFVTDEITDRGTVPYSFSLIFRGRDNDVFLKYPAKAFSPDAAEPYKSFCARVTPEAPTIASKEYDPKDDDYSSSVVFCQSEWVSTWGMDKTIFIHYFASLCEAVCSKQHLRIGVVLPSNKEGEGLILATLALLPLFMKRKFGAAASWTGMMDGSSSSTLSGIHLLCYHNESPASDSKLHIIDLTGPGGRTEVVDIKCRQFAEWVWNNIDNPDELTRFEDFLKQNFDPVLEKMPVEVVENCFILWSVFENQKTSINMSLAMTLVRLIADNFAKNFSKYPYISRRLNECLVLICQRFSKSSDAELSIKDIQVMCLLAGNGEETAQTLVYEIYKHFSVKKDWKKVAIPLTYYSGLLAQPGISAKVEEHCQRILLETLLKCMSDREPTCIRITQQALFEYCIRIKDRMLRNLSKSDSADKVFEEYKEIGSALYAVMNGKLPDGLFWFAELVKPVNSERFAEIVEFEISKLGFVPSVKQWLELCNWTGGLSDERMTELYMACYAKVGAQKGSYIRALEEQPKLLQTLAAQNNSFRGDVDQAFREMFEAEWGDLAYPLEQDTTWDFLEKWEKRLQKMGFKPTDDVFETIRQMAGLSKIRLTQIVQFVSKKSMSTASRLYGGDTSLHPILDELIEIDEIAADSITAFRNYIERAQRDNKRLSDDGINRMAFWCKKSPSVERALAVMAAREEFKTNRYLSLCRPQRDELRYTKSDIECLFAAINGAEEYRDSYFKQQVWKNVVQVIQGILTIPDMEASFMDHSVKQAYRSMQYPDKRALGEAIAEYLKKAKVNDGDTINTYVKRHKSGKGTGELPLLPMILLAVSLVGAVLATVGFIQVFTFGSNLMVPLLGQILSVWLPYVLALIVLAFSVINWIIDYRFEK